MQKGDYIRNQIQSNSDPFVQDLFTELDKRLSVLDHEGSFVERMKFSDAWAAIIITFLICVYFVVSISV